MHKVVQIGPGVFCVAGPEITDQRDAAAYLITDGEQGALIDAGAGPSFPLILKNIEEAGVSASNLKFAIATHSHIDHIGGLSDFAAYSPEIVIHSRDAAALESADPLATASSWYGLPLKPVIPSIKIERSPHVLYLGKTQLICVHTPGHTPGSMIVHLDRNGKRYLFGQDIHGPFHPMFGSDIEAWRDSMHLLISLKADVLAEGHLGVFYGRDEVAAFIRGYLERHAG